MRLEPKEVGIDEGAKDVDVQAVTAEVRELLWLSLEKWREMKKSITGSGKAPRGSDV